MVCDGRFKLVRGFDAAKPDKRTDGGADYTPSEKNTVGDALLLFDIENDPHEARDLSKERADLVERLGKLLPAAG